MFSIVPDFTFADIDEMIQKDLDEWFEALSKEMMATGKSQIDEAINKVNDKGYGKIFGNITYNLRSSMGCGIVVNGDLKETYFPFGKGDKGQEHGMEVLNSLVGSVEDDIYLIVVAGEKYGVFVQAKGYDVLAMAQGTFGDEFKKLVS